MNIEISFVAASSRASPGWSLKSKGLISLFKKFIEQSRNFISILVMRRGARGAIITTEFLYRI